MLDSRSLILIYYARFGPIVYRLGHELFMLGRGVRLSLGLPISPASAFQCLTYCEHALRQVLEANIARVDVLVVLVRLLQIA